MNSPKLHSYDRSMLRDWLRKDSWTAKEAVCLLSDIEPTGAVISWSGFTNPYGGRVDLPKVERGTLLSEAIDLSFFEDGERIFEQFGYVDEPFLSPHDIAAPPDHASPRYYSRVIAERRLRKAWDSYRRNLRHSQDDRRPPHEYISWGIQKDLEIPWLEWASARELISYQETSTKTLSLKKDKATKANKRDKKVQSEAEIAELRDMARDVAIKLKRDGIAARHITVTRVCEELLNRHFSNGKPVSSRWGTVEGMRAHLKKEHHPTRNQDFRSAKSDRTKFNR